MGIGKQSLDANGQPILTSPKCPHGIFRDDRGNSCCESCLDLRLTHNFLLGIAAAWEDAVKDFSKQAGDAYAEGNDDRARFLREMSKKAKEKGEAKRADYDRHKREYGEGVSEDPDADPFAKADESATY